MSRRSRGKATEGENPEDESWTLEPFEADDGTVPFERFADSLTDFKFAALDMAMEHMLADRGLDLAKTEWLKSLRMGLYEFRIRHEADEIARMLGAVSSGAGANRESVLLRVFVHFHGDKIVLLLGGYDKGRYSKSKRQQREIQTARKLLTQFKERRRREQRRRD